MKRYFEKATELASLKAAWQRIRENGSASVVSETREAVEFFSHEAEGNLRRIQRQLRRQEFEFAPQTGVLKSKSSGGRRGIVIAPISNRIVERAWLDCLQSQSSYVKSVISRPTSVGGVPNRSVPHGLKLIYDAFDAGNRFFVRSDISGFFDSIPRRSVIEKIALDVDDELFIDVLNRATRVSLNNEAALGEDRRVFPTDESGVAQGSPLSPLLGNILLYDFDKQFNAKGIVCVRFIDDFVMLSDHEGRLHKAFSAASRMLSNLNLRCHDPFNNNVSKDKASKGDVSEGFVFLGYELWPGLRQPSRKARAKLESAIDKQLQIGRSTISRIKAMPTDQIYSGKVDNRQRYIQTLYRIDRIIKGWGAAFAYSNSSVIAEHLDRSIDAKLVIFRRWFAYQIRDADYKVKRRLGGVSLLEDINRKDLDDVPLVVNVDGKFRRSKNTKTISTDGAVAHRIGESIRSKGRGGWAYVVHEPWTEVSGSVQAATNNEMELRAVIEAVKSVKVGGSVVIRTDSQYVANCANGKSLVKSNNEMWKEFQELGLVRKIRVVWVKGHAGDKHNERADKLASLSATGPLSSSDFKA